MLFLVVSTPRPERPSELVKSRQSFWPWMARYEAQGVCRQVYARVGRGAVAILDVEDNDALHRILNEWADIIPAHFQTYPLIDAAAAKRMLAAQMELHQPVQGYEPGADHRHLRSPRHRPARL